MSHLMKKVGLIFDENKVKPFLKMSIQRLQLLINKKTNQIKGTKKEIARLLADDREEKARIRVEQVIREDFTAEAYDILELHCELVAGRIRFLASQKECPGDMEQAVCTIIWAADRAEVSELSTVKSQFTKKYGAEFIRRAELNEDGCVNQKVVEKLACDPPSGFVVTEYLLGIAEEYGVDYTPAIPIHDVSHHDKPESSSASGPQAAYEASSHARDGSASPPAGGGAGSGGAGGSGGGGGRDPAGTAAPPPPVTAWAVSSPDIPPGMPQARAEPSHGHHPPSSWGAEGGGGGVAGKGAHVDPVGGVPPGYYPGGERGNRERRGSGGWEEATRGWGPSSQRPHGHVEEKRPEGAGTRGEGKVDDPPPPYTPYDIPSPPKDKPVSLRKFDIPAAPGYEDSPPQSPSGGRKSSNTAPPAPSAPSTNSDPSGGGNETTGGGGEFDDLESRFKNLRNF